MILHAMGQRIKPEIQTGDGRQSQMYNICPTTRYGEALGKQQTANRTQKNGLNDTALQKICWRLYNWTASKWKIRYVQETLNYKPKWRTDLETSYGDERTNYKSLTSEMSLNKCQV